MNKYKTYDPTVDPLALTPSDVTRIAISEDVQRMYATNQSFSTMRDSINIDLDKANDVIITYNHRTYTLDKDRLFMFLTTMFMKED
jgi:hypothetical protein